MSFYNLESKIKKTALYYPDILINDSSWIRYALLYWDEVASIVPQELDTYVKREDVHNVNLPYLIEVGEYRPIFPDELFKKSNSEYSDKLVSEMRAKVNSPEFKIKLKTGKSRTYNFRIHEGKAIDSLFDELIANGLVSEQQMENETGKWFSFEENTGIEYMSLLAKYLAEIDSHLTIPLTNKKNYRDNLFLTEDEEAGHPCVDVLIKGILPVPRNDVSYQDIIDFKRRRKDQLTLLNQEIHAFYNCLSNANNITDQKREIKSFENKVQTSMNDVTQLLNEAKINFSLSYVSSLLTIAIANDVSLPFYLECNGITVYCVIDMYRRYTTYRQRPNVQSPQMGFSYLVHASKDNII